MPAINPLLEALVKRKQTPSVQYYFFNHQELLHQFQAGDADLALERKADEHTSYHLLSLTKTFTALAILQLREKNRLDLDEPASRYLTGFPYPTTITIRHLLTHTAGLPNPIPLSWIHRADDLSFSPNDFFSAVFQKHHRLRSAPGERFFYSNLGYVLLGQIIEAITSLPYAVYIRKHICALLPHGEEMDMHILHPDQQATGYQKQWSIMNALLGFFIDKKSGMGPSIQGWKPFLPYYVNGAAYGGLIASPTALLSYAQDLLCPESRLISTASKELLLAPHRLNDGSLSPMGLGWFRGQLNGQPYIHHAGGGGGFYVELRLYPAAGMGSMVFFNRTGVKDEKFLNQPDSLMWKELTGGSTIRQEERMAIKEP